MIEPSCRWDQDSSECRDDVSVEICHGNGIRPAARRRIFRGRGEAAIPVAEQNCDAVAVCVCCRKIRDAVPIKVADCDGIGIDASYRTGRCGRKSAISFAEQYCHIVASCIRHREVQNSICVEVADGDGEMDRNPLAKSLTWG